MAPVTMPGPTLRAVWTSDSSDRPPPAANLQIARGEVDAEIDAQSDEHDAECDAENIQMADRERDVAERPGHSDQKRNDRDDRVANPAESGDEQA